MKYNLVAQSLKEVVFAKEPTLKFSEEGYGSLLKWEALTEETWQKIESLPDEWEIRFIDRGRVLLSNNKSNQIRFVVETILSENSGIARVERLSIDDRVLSIADLESQPLFKSIKECKAFPWIASRIACITNAR
jgi:hypothetical protein